MVRISRHGGGSVGEVHRGLAIAFCVLVVALAVTLVLGACRRRSHRWLWVGLAPVLVLASVTARSSGDALPWSQLALRAMTARGSYQGVWRAAFDPVVISVLADGELSRSAYRLQVMAHLFAAPAVLAVALALIPVCVKRFWCR